MERKVVSEKVIDVKKLRATVTGLLMSGKPSRGKAANRRTATPMDPIARGEGQAAASSGRRVTTPMDPIPRTESGEVASNTRKRTTGTDPISGTESEGAASNKRRKAIPMDPIPRAESPAPRGDANISEESGAELRWTATRALLDPGAQSAHTTGGLELSGWKPVGLSGIFFEGRGMGVMNPKATSTQTMDGGGRGESGNARKDGGPAAETRSKDNRGRTGGVARSPPASGARAESRMDPRVQSRRARSESEAMVPATEVGTPERPTNAGATAKKNRKTAISQAADATPSTRVSRSMAAEAQRTREQSSVEPSGKNSREGTPEGNEESDGGPDENTEEGGRETGEEEEEDDGETSTPRLLRDVGLEDGGTFGLRCRVGGE